MCVKWLCPVLTSTAPLAQLKKRKDKSNLHEQKKIKEQRKATAEQTEANVKGKMKRDEYKTECQACVGTGERKEEIE